MIFVRFFTVCLLLTCKILASNGFIFDKLIKYSSSIEHIEVNEGSGDISFEIRDDEDDENPFVLTKCNGTGIIALTFDDGPYFTTPSVLDVLKEKNVTATFFINGANWMSIQNETTQGIIRRTIAEGHTIGSHSWSHQNLTDATPDQIRFQMNELTNTLISLNLTSSKPLVMRPPFGSFNDEVISIVNNELGYIIVNWSINTRDWAHPGDTEAGLEDYVNVLNGTDPKITQGFISLHHDVQRGGDELARAVIDYSRSLGYRFVTLEECLGF